MQSTQDSRGIARVNGIAINGADEDVAPDELRNRACTELLRQAAQQAGLLSASDEQSADGLISEEAATAIDTLIGQAVQVPEPSEEACRRHYSAHLGRYTVGQRARMRHILFAVTPGVDVNALRGRAEAVLIDVRAHADGEDPFPDAARQNSNCPSSERGGDLGWLAPEEVVPEFARAIFGQHDIGVLPRLVHSRFGFHVIDVQERKAGTVQPFEEVRGTVAASLRQQSFATALRQYVALLAGQAVLEGVDMDIADTPLVQ
jgi:peptidyl-prolyl cis-trans isomerase C